MSESNAGQISKRSAGDVKVLQPYLAVCRCEYALRAYLKRWSFEQVLSKHGRIVGSDFTVVQMVCLNDFSAVSAALCIPNVH